MICPDPHPNGSSLRCDRGHAFDESDRGCVRCGEEDDETWDQIEHLIERAREAWKASEWKVAVDSLEEAACVAEEVRRP